MFRVGILTVSDKGHAGERVDTAGPELARLLDSRCFEVFAVKIVPDEPEAIAAQLTAWSDTDGLDLILTTGGTGMSPRTPPRRPRWPWLSAWCRASPRPCGLRPWP